MRGGICVRITDPIGLYLMNKGRVRLIYREEPTTIDRSDVRTPE